MSKKRMTISEAADALGITPDAIRKRVSRGIMDSGKDERGRTVVFVDTSETRQDNVSDNSETVISLLRDEIAHLRREADWKNATIAQLSRAVEEQAQTIRALEAPTSGLPDDTESPETDAGDASRGNVADEPQRGAERRSWWERIIGR